MKKLLLCLFIVMSGAMTATTIKNCDAGPTNVDIYTNSATCSQANGSLTFGTVYGGVAPYTYSIDGGTTYSTNTTYLGLYPTTYPIVVKDSNGDMYTINLTISDSPGPIGVVTSSTDSHCGTADATVTIGAVTGGTAPYTYAFAEFGGIFSSTTFYTGFVAGTYSLYVKDANGCIYSTSVTIINIPGPTAIVTTATDVSSCGASDGSITLGAVTGGTPPYVYAFNGSAYSGITSYTGLYSGSYFIEVKDANGCVFTTSGTVAGSSIYQPTTDVVTQPTCAMSSGTIVITPQAGVEYSVDNGASYQSTTTFSGLVPGNYTVRVRSISDNTCSIPAASTVIINTLPIPPATPTFTVIQPSCSQPYGSIIFDAQGGVQYSINGGLYFTSNDTFTALTGGTYTILVRNSLDNTCTSAPTTVNINPSYSLGSIGSSTTGTYVDFNADGFVNIGDVINYQYTLTNCESSDFTDISLSNSNVTINGGPLSILAAGATDSTTFTGTYTLTQADINNGYYTVDVIIIGTLNSMPVTSVATNTTYLTITDGIKLNAFYDNNGNGVQNSGENNYYGGEYHYELNNTGTVHNISASYNSHTIYETNSANSYDVSFTTNNPNYIVSPSSYSNITVANGSGITTYNFPITVTPYTDLRVTLSPGGGPRPGFTYGNYIYLKNIGDQTTPAGTLIFTNDSRVTITGVSPSATITGTGFTYNYPSLLPNQYIYIYVTIQVPTIPTINLGDLLTNTVSVDIPSGDAIPTNNIASLTQDIRGSYDPNDKVESHGPQIVHSTFTSNDYLSYTIQFENTGTADAINVKVDDILDAKLDETSVKMIDASHNYTLDRVGNDLTWHFDGINLPPSVAGTSTGKGYVNFQIKPKAGYAVGDIINNTANIYFDFNPAIVTNTFSTEFVNTLGVTGFENALFSAYPNPTKGIINISLKNNANTIDSVIVTDVLGKTVQSNSIHSSNATIDISHLTKGLYFVKIQAEGMVKTLKVMKE